MSSIAVHVFVDASLEAYGAVVYVRVKYQDGSLSVRLVSSKTKVAPLQSVSVPRLELMGAVLGSRLATSISDALDMEKQSYTFWTDSANVLWWIRGYSRTFKSFVANRVGEIHSSSSPDQWRYVPTKLNPADYFTRGVKLMELVELRMWWEGPEYFKEDESQWPRNVVDKRPASAVEEVKQKYTVKEPSEEKSAFMTTTTKIIWRLQPECFSNWNKLTRLQAWVMRFTTNCRSHQHERLLDKGINLEEIRDAEKLILKTTQKECFKEEYTTIVERKKLPKNSKLLSLCPRLDDDGVMRSEGRLKYGEFLPYDVRYPIILPRKSWITKLIVKHHHELGNHSVGTNQILSTLSSKYWIVAAREAIIEWERECAMRKRKKAKRTEQIMAPLPLNRLTTSLRAFARVGVDFAGPFITVQGRGKRRQKRYLCLFTCLSCRAVHLEIAYGLDVDSFLTAFS